MASVKEQMDLPVATTHAYRRPFSDHGLENKTINNIDNRRNMDAKDGARARDGMSAPRMQSRLPNVYAGAPESNLWLDTVFQRRMTSSSRLGTSLQQSNDCVEAIPPKTILREK